MLNTHEKALESSTTAYHEFLLIYKNSENKIVFGFVEGKDDPSFYKPIIENMLPEGWGVRLIPTGSKRKVLNIFNEIDWKRFPKKRICFFVDKDLSLFLSEAHPTEDNFYVTDQYSIENDVVNFNMLECFLSDCCGIVTITDSERCALKCLFDDAVNAFCEALVPIMTQVISWQRNGEKPSLSNIRLRDIILLVEGKVAQQQGYSLPENKIAYASAKCGLPISDEAVLKCIEEEFRKMGIRSYTRGKYLMWFFVEYAKHIHALANIFCSRYPLPPKIRLSVGHTNIMVALAPRARAPLSLKKFVQKSYIEYIEAGNTVDNRLKVTALL